MNASLPKYEYNMTTAWIQYGFGMVRAWLYCKYRRLQHEYHMITAWIQLTAVFILCKYTISMQHDRNIHVARFKRAYTVTAVRIQQKYTINIAWQQYECNMITVWFYAFMIQ